MKTKKQFSQAAGVLSSLANDCRPEDPNGPYANSENLIVYHLRAAAAIAQRIAEAKTE